MYQDSTSDYYKVKKELKYKRATVLKNICRFRPKFLTNLGWNILYSLPMKYFAVTKHNLIMLQRINTHWSTIQFTSVFKCNVMIFEQRVWNISN